MRLMEFNQIYATMYSYQFILPKETNYFAGLVLHCSLSRASAMEILQSCTKPSICRLDLGFAYKLLGIEAIFSLLFR